MLLYICRANSLFWVLYFFDLLVLLECNKLLLVMLHISFVLEILDLNNNNLIFGKGGTQFLYINQDQQKHYLCLS